MKILKWFELQCENPRTLICEDSRILIWVNTDGFNEYVEEIVNNEQQAFSWLEANGYIERTDEEKQKEH